jgi:hypothetical protein
VLFDLRVEEAFSKRTVQKSRSIAILRTQIHVIYTGCCSNTHSWDENAASVLLRLEFALPHAI